MQHINNDENRHTISILHFQSQITSLCCLSLSLFILAFCCSFVFSPSFSAPMLTYLWMVSSAWFAWSKCPPLHPCYHRGNQLFQTTQRVLVLYVFTISSACRCVLIWLHSSVSCRDFAPVVSSLWSQICHWGTTLFFELIPISFSKHTYTSCSCATPSVLCLILISQPFTLIPAPCSPHALLLLWGAGHQGYTQ